MTNKIKKSVACLFVACMGMTITSCDSETLKAWLPIVVEVIQNTLTGKGDGSVKSYVASGTLDIYDFKASDNTYDPNTKKSASPTMNATLTIYENSDPKCITIALDKFTVGDATISDFSFTTYWEEGKIDPAGLTSEDEVSYLTGGTCTYNGKAETAIDACAIVGTYSNERMKLSKVYIQIGNKLIMGTLNGINATENQ